MMGKLLGEGANAHVYLARTRRTLHGIKQETEVALKVFFDASPSSIKKIAKEVAMLKRLSSYGQCSSYIVCYYDDMVVTHKGEEVYIVVMEYIRGSELSAFIDLSIRQEDEPYDILSFLSVEDIMSIFSQLLEGLAYMHSRNIVHRDIKPENIIIDPIMYEVKYVDLGFACFATITDDEHRCIIEKRGTAEFISPELARLKDAYKIVSSDDDIEFLKKVDIWALGIVFYELIFGDTPTLKMYDSSESNAVYFERLMNFVLGEFPPYDKRLKRFVDLIVLMLFSNYKKRFDAETALQFLNT